MKNPNKYVLGFFGIVMRRGKVLIMRRRLDDTLGGTWDLPGGGHAKGELPEETVRREVREEAGLKVQVGEVCHIYGPRPSLEAPGAEFFGIGYICRSARGKVRLSTEHTEYVWMNEKDFAIYKKEMAKGVRLALEAYFKRKNK